jgi:hypothetical protein
MLMVESERARLLRQAILDIVIDTINQRTGGGTQNTRSDLHKPMTRRFPYSVQLNEIFSLGEQGVLVKDASGGKRNTVYFKPVPSQTLEGLSNPLSTDEDNKVE